MGTGYAIMVLFGLAFIGGAMLIFAIEDGKANLLPKIGCSAIFIFAAVILYYVVGAILKGET